MVCFSYSHLSAALPWTQLGDFRPQHPLVCPTLSKSLAKPLLLTKSLCIATYGACCVCIKDIVICYTSRLLVFIANWTCNTTVTDANMYNLWIHHRFSRFKFVQMRMKNAPKFSEKRAHPLSGPWPWGRYASSPNPNTCLKWPPSPEHNPESTTGICSLADDNYHW